MQQGDDLVDLDLEWKLRAWAVPAALALAVAFHAWSMGHFLQRTFLSMMVHEAGHAVTAWWCGFKAMPTLWKTMIGESRTLVAELFVGLLCVAVTARWALAQRWALAACGAAAAALWLGGTFGLSVGEAQALITFGGDGGAMVLGTILMATFFVGRDTQIYRGALRWGFLVIGAAAFVDTFATWWSAQDDARVIPFGEIEGVGLSDPSKLKDVFGWKVDEIVDRYVTLGAACLVALAAVYAWGVWSARREAREARADRAARAA